MADTGHQHVARNLAGDWNRLALLSSSPSTSTAIVFVHGFAGHAVKTWNQFHRLLSELAVDEPWWCDADLYFFGYDGVRQSTNSNARLLTNFLQEVFPTSRERHFRIAESTAFAGNPNGPREIVVRPGPYGYKSLILVGHSEGGVIIRLAMMKAARELERQQRDQDPSRAAGVLALIQLASREGWSQPQFEKELQSLQMPSPPEAPPLLRSQIRLFAPAISGSRLTGPLGFLNASMFGKVVRPFVKSLRAYHDLETGSPVLNNLRDETNRFALMWPHISGLRAAIVWARDDDTVSDQSFQPDVEWWEDNASHTSVCKPRPEFMMPIRFVEKGHK